MEMTNVEFGFYPYRFDSKLAVFEISSLVGIDEKVTRVMSDSGVYQNWIYAPPQEQQSLGVPSSITLPYASRVFGLPKTHLLKHSSGDLKRLSFLVWSFGFFVGMRMSDQEMGFLDAAALQRGASNDLVWSEADLGQALEKADKFYESHAASPEIALVIRAVIHSFLLSATPTLLDFERFLHLYTAVDAAFSAHILIHGKPTKRQLHGERIAYLCEALGLLTPWWADRNSPYVAERRNETIHEGLFFGEPWGYTTFGGEQRNEAKYRMILLELQKLLCRIVMALLGVRDEKYLKSPVDDRQKHRIRLVAE
jgi:hypothetical protein